ncbi:AraC family transcriptional regulator [Mesorhizobium sp. WSM4884]|nr:AraC family transcriptional regulator [Mesorhizobium sp. WSM4884]
MPRVTIGRSEAPTPPLPELCQPTALFVLQGTKSMLIGDRTLRYGAGSCFVYAVETPATSQLIEASTAHPYMAIAFSLNIEVIATLLIDHKLAAGGDSFATYPPMTSCSTPGAGCCGCSTGRTRSPCSRPCSSGR